MPGATVGERIRVHLSGFLRHADAYEVPPEMTPDRIAAALGISRTHVALELKQLRMNAKVEERRTHLANARTRRKVYIHTPSGQEIACADALRIRTREGTLLTLRGREDGPRRSGAGGAAGPRQPVGRIGWWGLRRTSTRQKY